MLSALGLKKTIRKEINYLVFIDEIYLYLMKDIQYDKTKPYMRRLGNKYSLYLFENVSFNKLEDSNSYRLFIEMVHPTRKDDILEKELFFTENTAQEFFIYLQKSLTSLGIMQEENVDGTNNEEVGDNENNQVQSNQQEEVNDVDNKEEVQEVVNENTNKEPDIVIQDDNTTKEESTKEPETKKEEDKKEEEKKEEEKKEDDKKEEDKQPEVKHKKKKKLKKKKAQTDSKEEDIKDRKPEAEDNTDNI